MPINIKDKLDAFKTALGGGQKADEITNALLEQVVSVTKQAVDAGLTTKEIAAEPPAADPPADEGGDADPSENFIGDMTLKDFVPFMNSLIKNSTVGAAAPVTKEVIAAAITEALTAPNAATTKAASDIAALNASITAMAGQLTAMQATLKELTNDEPRIMRGFIASQSSETVKQVTIEQPRVDEIDQIAAHVASSWGGQS